MWKYLMVSLVQSDGDVGGGEAARRWQFHLGTLPVHPIFPIYLESEKYEK